MRANAFVCLLVMGVAAEGYADEGATPELPFRKTVLPNGLTVLLSEDHRLPLVAVDVWYHVGAANQTPGRSGFAHLFEHMMFSGAKHIGRQPWNVLEGLGAPAGLAANGSTGPDRTRYFEELPARQLPAALWFESDRMGFLLDTLDDTRLKVQRDVVSNERRQMYDNRPHGGADIAICDAFFPKPHPYFECVIGSIAEVQSASVEDVRRFVRAHYTPQNASLAIVGDIDPDQALALVQQYFGPIPRGPSVPPPSASPPTHTPPELVVTDPNIQTPQQSWVWPGVRPYDTDEAAGNVLAFILAKGKTSRLSRALMLDRQLAASVDAKNDAMGLGGLFEVDVTVAPSQSVSDVRGAVEQVMADVRTAGVTADEVSRGVRNLLADKMRALERLGGYGGKADLLNEYQVYTGDPGYLSKDFARYRALTPEAIQRFATTYLTNERRMRVDVQPAPASGAHP